MRAVLHKVIRPHVIAVLRFQPKARAIGQPKPAAFGLLGGNFKPLLPPDPFNPLVVDDPTRARPQQLRDFAVAIAAILAGEFDDIASQRCFVIASSGCLALSGAVLTERRARATLGDLELTPNMLNHSTAACGA